MHLLLEFEKLTDPSLIDLGSFAHLRKREFEAVSARSPDEVPVEECKRALHTESISDEALHRRCAGEGEGEEESGFDGNSEEGGDDDAGGNHDDDGDVDNTQISSNSPRQVCLLTHMELVPMPNFGVCESLPDTPPTPDPVPPATPAPIPITPQPQSDPAPAPAPIPVPAPPSVHKPVPANAGEPARAIPKREIQDGDLEGESNQSS